MFNNYEITIKPEGFIELMKKTILDDNGEQLEVIRWRCVVEKGDADALNSVLPDGDGNADAVRQTILFNWGLEG